MTGRSEGNRKVGFIKVRETLRGLSGDTERTS